ncbi:MAG: hypothetical protein MUF43_14720, partial [Flavobacterium sp.]|nr:hypothetical protein [Flavobacterium sp.]
PAYMIEYDSIYCYGLTPTINLITDSTNKVTWINGIGRLDDINSFTPKVLNNEDFVFRVEIDNGFCIKEVDVPVNFEQKLNLSGILDSITICPGTTLTVKLPPQYSYTFESPVTISCNNPECTEISFTANNDVKIEIDQTEKI